MWRRTVQAAGSFACATLVLCSCSTPSTPAAKHRQSTTGSTRRAGAAKPVYGPPWGFGGYYDTTAGPVSSIGATWRVPRISPSSGAGVASTWIAADNGRGNFIQLGLIESATTSGSRTDRKYTAFWSDTDLHDLGHTLMPVSPGDTVHFTMVHSRHGWHLVVRDLTSRHTRSFSTRYGAGDVFTRGQWLQEDPVANVSSLHDRTYPIMQTPLFRKLTLDGRAPVLSYAEASALVSPNGIVLIPTPARGDSFGFTHGDAAQARYLRDTLPLDYALNGFNLQLPHLARLTASARLRVFDATISGASALSDGLLHQRWPATAKVVIHNLAAHNQLIVETLRQWRSAAPGASARWQSRYEELVANDPYYADAARAALGLPPAT